MPLLSNDINILLNERRPICSVKRIFVVESISHEKTFDFGNQR